jgi:hypothetical protein
MVCLSLYLLTLSQRLDAEPEASLDGRAFIAIEVAANDFRRLKFPPHLKKIENYTIDVERTAKDYVVSFGPKKGPSDLASQEVHTGSITSLGLGMIFYIDIKTLRFRRRTAMP